MDNEEFDKALIDAFNEIGMPEFIPSQSLKQLKYINDSNLTEEEKNCLVSDKIRLELTRSNLNKGTSLKW